MPQDADDEGELPLAGLLSREKADPIEERESAIGDACELPMKTPRARCAASSGRKRPPKDGRRALQVAGDLIERDSAVAGCVGEQVVLAAPREDLEVRPVGHPRRLPEIRRTP